MQYLKESNPSGLPPHSPQLWMGWAQGLFIDSANENHLSGVALWQANVLN